MKRNEARSFASQIANEIQIELSKAGYQDASNYVGSKTMREFLRSIADSLTDYE